MNAFVVTTRIRGTSKTQVWEPSQPLAIGFPFQWILERSENGVRIRSLSQPTGKIVNGGVREIPHDELLRGAEFETAQDDSKIQFLIRPARELKPLFESAAAEGALQIYECNGPWVQASRTAGATYIGRAQERNAFRLQRTAGSSYRIQAEIDGIVLQGSENRELKSGESTEFGGRDIAGLTIRFGAMSWRFGLASAPEFVDRADRTLAASEVDLWFKKSLRYAAIGLGAFAVMSWFWPQTKEDPKELVPAQFTKIVMTQPKKAAPAASSDAGAPATANLPKKVQEAAVVQAFRAKALNNAVSGLLKGGMTKLLAQSDFVTGGKSAQEARRILDSKSDALKATTPTSGAMGDKNVQIASLGGDAQGLGGGGKAIGYGKGEKAALKGQGKGFVPFVSADANGSLVDEGLTKDEVGEVIHRHLSEVRYCYEAAMVRTPDIEGKLITNFTIIASGVVKSAEVKSSTLPDPRLDDCILRRLVTWQFPKPRGGVDVSVSYPFIFKTLGR